MIKTKYLFFIAQNYGYSILRPVQAAAAHRNSEVAWFLSGHEVNSDYLTLNEPRLHSISDIFEYSPDAILYPANIAPTFLPGINVATFHGFDAGKLDRSGNNDHYKIRNCFDLYCTQGPLATQKFEQLKTTPSHFEVIETGWCALDPLFNQATTPKNDQRKTVLLCSTFSKNLSCAPSLFETVKHLSATGRWRWLVQFHPKMNEQVVNQYKNIQSEHLTFVETDNIIPLLQQADIMVCDTSSIMMSFLLQTKPVVTFRNISPQDYLVNITDEAALEETIEYALTKPKNLMKHIKQFITETHPYCDGRSSERLLDAIDTVISEKDKLAQKPVDFFRQFKMRKRLNYWKL